MKTLKNEPVVAKLPEGALLISSVSIIHYLKTDGDKQVMISSEESSGDEVGIVSLIGMLEYGKALITHDYLGRDNFEND